MFFISGINSVIIFVVSILIVLVTYFKWIFKYWERKKIAYVTPSFPFGNMGNSVTTKIAPIFVLQKIYKKLKSEGYRFGGVFIIASPQLLPISPEIVKDVMTKDFGNFVDRGFYYNEEGDPISAHLFSIEGDKWKSLRAKLTPTFTSGKIKMMLQTLIDCGKALQVELDKLCTTQKEFDIKEFSCCYTTDVIGSCAFGIDCNSFTTDSKFRKYCKAVLKPKIFDAIKINFCVVFPRLARYLNLSFTDKGAAKFFMDVVKETVDYRLKNNITRKDFMQILMEVKDDNNEGLTMEQMAAQAFVFFLGGFETSSTTMTYCLYELCENQNIQDTLRKEINEVLMKHDGKITYESIGEMKYMNQVIDETLRKYPPLPTLNRIVTKDYNISETDILLEKGTRVAIPVYALQHDEEYFPDPEKFDPERFSEINKHNIVPYTYLPFGDGPRGCIGTRFGLIQTKVGLATVLQNYKFTINTRTEIPLVMDPLSFMLSTKNIIYLNVHKI